MPKKRMVLFGGMGYPVTETPMGMPNFKKRLEAIGFEVLLISWKQRQEAYNFMYNFVGWRGYGGDSLGAGSAGQFPGDVKGNVDFAAGFQPSMDDARTVVVKYPNGTHAGIQTIAANIVRAHCITDPRWIDTVGLGQARWAPAHGASTILLITEHHGAHPDDWGYSQDLIFSEIQAQVK